MVRCPACGHENPGTNRFCGACGSPLSTGANPPELRKTVTVLFCDLVGSTAMGEALDPEKLRMITRRYFDAMRAPIERHGGTVEKFIGDAVMAVFGVPQIHEDDAVRAVRAAADMRDVLLGLNPELERDHGVTLGCRIGVNTGEVVTGSGDAIVVGDTVNVAARLEQAAPAGEILIGEVTHRLVREAVTAEPVDALDLKGKSAAVLAYRLVTVTPGAAGFSRHLDAPIVGRERELALLRSAFERTVTDDACQLFTLLGVAGVGKSRLMAAFVDGIADDATILRGRCLPYGEGITFYPLAEALIEAAGLRETDTPEAARGRLAALMGPDPQAERIGDLVGQAIGIRGSEAAPDETLWAIRMLLQHLAAERPVVFVVDDVQWAEPKLLELVEHIADFADDAPILLACMARPEFLDDLPAWGGGKLNATSILLEPLDADACGALVGNLLADRVDDAVRAMIVDAAAGNPLYAEEVTGLLIDEGRLVLKEGRWTATGDLGDAPVPATVSALLAARLDALPAEQRRLVDVASVIGQVFYPAAVRALTDGRIGDADTGIRALVRQQFIRQERSDVPGFDALAFRHILIRDTAYGALAKAERADLHERFADWLEGTGGALGEEDQIVGYHLERAYRYRTELAAETERERTLADRAGRLLAGAGTRASARGDHHATINLLSRASSLLAADDPLRIAILPDLGVSMDAAGDADGSRAVLDEAVDRAAAAGDERMRLHAYLQRRLISWSTDDADTERREADRAIRLFEEAGDERGLARAWRLRAFIRRTDTNLADDDALETALSHARRAGDIGEQAAVYWSIGFNLARGPTPVSDAVRRCREILAQTEGNRTLSAEMYHALGHLLARQGAFDEALEFATRCREINRENGYLWAYWSRAEIVWDIKMLAGETEEALDVLAEGYQEIDRMGMPIKIMSAWLAQSLCALDRFDEAEQPARVAAEAADDDWARYTGFGALGRVLAQRGELDEAERLAREAATWFDGTEYSIDRTAVILDLAEVLRVSGRDDDAVAVLRHALELFEQREDVVSAAGARASIATLA